MLVFRNEADFSHWFRKNLCQFGYERAIRENLGAYRSPYPDLWCLKEPDFNGDRLVESVELEALSFNFFRHGHDLSQVDRVIAAEDNCALYGVEMPAKFEAVGAYINGTDTSARCYYKAKGILAKEGVARRRSLPNVLLWWQLPGATECIVCHRDLQVVRNHVYLRDAEARHGECMEAIPGMLEEYILPW